MPPKKGYPSSFKKDGYPFFWGIVILFPSGYSSFFCRHSNPSDVGILIPRMSAYSSFRSRHTYPAGIGMRILFSYLLPLRLRGATKPDIRGIKTA